MNYSLLVFKTNHQPIFITIIFIIFISDGWQVLRNWSLMRWELRSALARIQSRYGARPYFDISVRQGSCNGGLGLSNFQAGSDADLLVGCIVLNPPKLGLPHRDLYYKPSDHPVS